MHSCVAGGVCSNCDEPSRGPKTLVFGWIEGQESELSMAYDALVPADRRSAPRPSFHALRVEFFAWTIGVMLAAAWTPIDAAGIGLFTLVPALFMGFIRLLSSFDEVSTLAVVRTGTSTGSAGRTGRRAVGP